VRLHGFVWDRLCQIENFEKANNLKEAVYGLKNDPRPQGYKKLKGREGYPIRIGDY
jgi:hypothetical protein